MANEGYPAGNGGSVSATQLLLRLTGAATLAAGALLYGDGDASLATLAPGTNGHVLTLAGGLPTWAASPAAALPGSYAVGDLLYASGASALAKLAAVATGNALISGGVTTAPAWGKIGLTTHVTGILPSANGGTGVSNAGTLTNASNTTITGGGTLALGGFTLTVPATGTAALLGTAQTITGVKTFDADLAMATNRNIRTVTNADYLSLIGGVTLSSDPGFQIFGSTYGSGISGRIYMDSSRLVLRGINGATNGVVEINGTTASTSTTTGALVLAGGIGCAGAGYFGGLINGAAGVTIAGAILNNQSSGQFLKIRRSDFGTMEFGVSDNETWRIQAQGTSSETLAWQKVSSGTPAAVFSVTTTSFSLASGVSFSAAMGTIAADTKVIDSTVTWNSGGVTFTGWKLDVTDTASASASLLLDLQVGGSSRASIAKTGQLRIAGGTVTTSAPMLNLTQTWNAGGVTFQGVLINVTTTTSAAASTYLDVQEGGTSLFKVGKFGKATIANYTASDYALSITSLVTLLAGVTDSYLNAINLAPNFLGSQAITRHNYIRIADPTLGSNTLGDACVFAFDAAAGTHKAVDAGTTKTSPGTVSAWVKVNINGTVHYLPAYTSKTT